MKLRGWTHSILLIASMCLVLSSAVGAETMTWTVGGVERQALVIAPTKKSDSGKAPLLFAFHGHGDTMEDFAQGTEFPGVWPEAIIVYMQGLPTNISAVSADSGGGYGWIYQPGPDGQRDVLFFDAVLQTMRTKFHVDDRRIYATGFSNGGMFTYALWGARANVFAAFAVVSGRIFPTVRLSEPKPLLHIAGEADRAVRYEDQVQAIQVARAVNGTSETASSCGARCTMYPSAKGTPVVTYLHSGGHVYLPGTSEMIVKFLKDYTLPQ